MLAGSKIKTNLFLAAGFIVAFIGKAISAPDSTTNQPVIGWILILIGSGVFSWGCSIYARGKGHHPALGLLGLLSLIRFIVLAFLPDHYKCCDTGGPTCTHWRAKNPAFGSSSRTA